MSTNYFYGQQSDQFSFYRLPKVLFTSELYKGLSTDAKVLYGLLLDRMNLSAKNEWKDNLGRVYTFFTLKEIQESLQCKDNKATKLLNELEKKYDLIERERLGLGKPCLIYVKNFIVDNNVESHFCNRENNDSAIGNNTNQESLKSRCNNTESNKNDNNDIDPSIYPEKPKITLEERLDKNDYHKYLQKQLDYDSLIIQYKYNVGILNEAIDIIADTLSSTCDTIRIGNEYKPIEIVKSQFMKMENRHMQRYMDSMLANTAKIKNIRLYALTSLYNAVSSNGYSNAVPMYSAWIEFLESLLPSFIGLKWIKHKNYIETQIDYLKKRIESEQIDEILTG